jgi:hypothetical protein
MGFWILIFWIRTRVIRHSHKPPLAPIPHIGYLNPLFIPIEMKLFSAAVLGALFATKGIGAFSLLSSAPTRNNIGKSSTSLFATPAGLVKITDVEAELIARKLREEIIDFPGVPNFMEKALVEQIIKAIIDVCPLVLPEDVFKRLIAGEAGMDGLSEAVIRRINEEIYIPILTREAQNALVEQICTILFSPTSFKKVRRQMLSRTARNLLNEDSRVVLATQLNDMFDIPFVSEKKEQLAAEKLVNLCYGIFETVIPPPVLDILETSDPEELREVRNNLITRLNEKIDVPFASEKKEEETLRFIVDFFLNYYGLSEGTKNPDEQIVDTEHKLRATEIELEALLDITQEQIDDLTTSRDALREKLVGLSTTVCPPPTPVENVLVLKDADAVGKYSKQVK